MEKFIVEELVHSISDDDLFSSEEDEDYEEEEDPPQKLSKITNFVEETVKNYSDKTFQTHFRLERLIVNYLIEKFQASPYSPENKRGKDKVYDEKTILLTIWYLANTESFRQIADRFNVSISSAHLVLVRGLNFLLSIAKHYVKWPSPEQYDQASEGFQKIKGIPDVIGAIDGSHIEIRRPNEHQEAYVNRKGYHSIVLQGIVSHDKKFIDAYCGEPGSLHDARVLRRSKIFRTAEQLFTNGKCLLGDSAYPSLSWLVPPFKDNGNLSEEQKSFNMRHSQTRIAVENAFGLLKGRFRRLGFFENLHIKIIIKCVLAACVLHNICILKNDATAIEMGEDDNALNENILFVGDNVVNVDKRQEIFNNMFHRN